MKLLAFDLDNTLLKVNSAFAFAKYLHRQKILSSFSMGLLFGIYGLHKARLLSVGTVHYWGAKILLKPENFSHLDLFLTQLLETELRPSVWCRFEQGKREGMHTLLISSSPDFLVQPIAERLGFSSWKATRYHAEGVEELLLGEDKSSMIKAFALASGWERSEVAAYSDSWLDLPMLETVGTPVAVAPDRQLRRVARSKGWEILE